MEALGHRQRLKGLTNPNKGSTIESRNIIILLGKKNFLLLKKERNRRVYPQEDEFHMRSTISPTPKQDSLLQEYDGISPSKGQNLGRLNGKTPKIN